MEAAYWEQWCGLWAEHERSGRAARAAVVARKKKEASETPKRSAATPRRVPSHAVGKRTVTGVASHAAHVDPFYTSSAAPSSSASGPAPSSVSALPLGPVVPLQKKEARPASHPILSAGEEEVLVQRQQKEIAELRRLLLFRSELDEIYQS